MKRLIFVLVIIGIVSSISEAKYSGGTGDANNPYQISNAADLLALAADTNDYDKHFILTADIDLDPNLPGRQVFNTAVIAPDKQNVPAFSGSFDGVGHKILNLTINSENDYLGLFGYINGGEVKNLGLENVKISGVFGISGGLVGNDTNGIISNCYSTGNFNSEDSGILGGLVGQNTNGSISNCYSAVDINSGEITWTHNFGGLVGVNNGQISNCYSTGNITVKGDSLSEPPDFFGGLVGTNRGTISDCHSTGSVSGGWGYSGGLVGWSVGGQINNCYSTGAVSGVWCYIAGLVGCNGGYGVNSIINNCYSTGAVFGDANSGYIGGLVGMTFYDSNISNCYSISTVTGGNGSSHIGGLVGSNNFSGDYNNIISKSYAAGAIRGGDGAYRVGGLIGYDGGNGSINNCYSIGDVNGGDYSNQLGGLIGYDTGGVSINNCYSIGDVNGGINSNYLGGLIGYSNGSNIGSCYFLDISGPNNGYGTPLTDGQMKQQASFVGWDFVWETANGTEDIWAICENICYPRLAWQFILGDFDNNKNVNFIDFAKMALKWLEADSSFYCGGTDLTGDSLVDVNDLAILCNHWLEGTTP